LIFSWGSTPALSASVYEAASYLTLHKEKTTVYTKNIMKCSIEKVQQSTDGGLVRYCNFVQHSRVEIQQSRETTLFGLPKFVQISFQNYEKLQF
jgi:hypothetical protein